ncbi:hypothetical protein [Pseudodonghicola xiamenensis]|uniref:Uncharacterized protein n=1 Tax=Pseudodonghicola xiamenensis TaxID=337702 RepID=A0A8J3H7V9_9RHOB|nr:hypothetical protein [Pseudodonghicola xiamenensis]GHG97935.1 hypothetical protein GCM10010961_33020 [Pseudodonghicola xiamenensis]
MEDTVEFFRSGGADVSTTAGRRKWPDDLEGLGNQTPQQARRALEQFEGSAPGALASDEAPEYQNRKRCSAPTFLLNP